jgi:hypothetical protein
MKHLSLTVGLLSIAVAFGCTAQEEPTALPESPGPQMIVNGEPTGAAYSNVGALFVDFSGDGIQWYDQVCSGSLIAPTIFLTAAHCLAWLPPGTPVHVSFDPDLVDGGVSPLIAADGFVFDPEYGHDRADMHDLGLVMLPDDGSTDGITPLLLPPAGYLTEAAQKGGLRGQYFVNVGYGAQAEFKGAPPTHTWDGKRRVSKSVFMALQPNWLGLLMNEDATGEGGDCAGDSGSPKFLDGNPDMIVATVTWGDAVCRATSWDYRLDTPSARDFLGTYVTLP